MRRKPKAKDVVVSLEIGQGCLKAAEASYFKDKKVLRLLSKALPSREEGAISQEIAALFKSHNIVKRRVLLNLQRHLAIARFLHLPSTNDEEIGAMAKIESAKQIPHTEEEIITSHKVIMKHEDGYSDVLSVVVQGQVINRLVNIAKGAGLEVVKIAIGSESLLSWYSLAARSTGEDVEANVAVINICSEYVDIDILEKTGLAFTRAFSHSLKDSTDDMAEEVKRTIATYQKSRGAGVQKIFISGAGDKAAELEAALKNRTETPVTVIAQNANLEIDSAAPPDLAGESFVELAGLALNLQDINLLPERIIRGDYLRTLRYKAIRTLALCGAIILLLLTLVAKNIWNSSRYLARLDSEIKKMEPKVAKAKRMKEDIRILREEIQKKPLAIDILTEIYKITPSGTTYSLMDYESGKALVIKGTAPGLDDIIKFISVLEGSVYFESVKVKYTAKRPIAGRETTDFEIVASLSKSGE